MPAPGHTQGPSRHIHPDYHHIDYTTLDYSFDYGVITYVHSRRPPRIDQQSLNTISSGRLNLPAPGLRGTSGIIQRPHMEPSASPTHDPPPAYEPPPAYNDQL